MLFNSAAFLIFFPVVTTAYFLLPHRFRWMLLLAASCYFYMAFIPKYILILAVTITVDYFAGLGLEKFEGRTKRWVLLASILTNIGMLAFFNAPHAVSDHAAQACEAAQAAQRSLDQFNRRRTMHCRSRRASVWRQGRSWSATSGRHGTCRLTRGSRW